ncbi:MAG: hypothetical protein ABMA64_25425 [Myxococcota bacterium]
MARWEEVQERMRVAFQLDRDDPNEFALTVPRQVAPASSREQRVMVRRFVAFDREMIEFRSAFGELGDATAEDLLRESLHLPLGAIALHGRFLVVVHRESLEPLGLDDVLFLLTHISLVADELEERRGSDRF